MFNYNWKSSIPRMRQSSKIFSFSFSHSQSLFFLFFDREVQTFTLPLLFSARSAAADMDAVHVLLMVMYLYQSRDPSFVSPFTYIYITAFLFPGLIHVVYIFMGILPKQLHEECNRTHELNSVVKFIRLKTVTHEGFIILSLIV